MYMHKRIVIVVLIALLLGACGSLKRFVPNLPSEHYFVTVNEVLDQQGEIENRAIRISGVVVGDSIEYNQESLTLSFQIADIPGDLRQVEKQGGLALVLDEAVNDPTNSRIQVLYTGVKPDLLQHKAQVIMTGQLHADGIFYADEMLLKCPTKYEGGVPDQVDD